MSKYARRRAHSTRQQRIHVEVAEGAEASRRVAWAKYYEELDRADRLATLKMMADARCEDLVEMLMQLTDAVLTKSNLQAFAIAYRIKEAVDRFLEHERKRTA